MKFSMIVNHCCCFPIVFSIARKLVRFDTTSVTKAMSLLMKRMFQLVYGDKAEYF